MTLEVLFSPAEFEAMAQHDLAETACGVFDILRATSTIVTALANGAHGIRPVATVEEALARRAADAGVLLAGERNGLRIGSRLAGGLEFDLGNSPREFTAERVAGRQIVMTTTNGTRALRACEGAALVVAGAFLNFTAIVTALRVSQCRRVVLVCSGTGNGAALEDVLAAGACCNELAACMDLTDSAWIARDSWLASRSDLPAAVARASNAQRLRGRQELADDVDECLRRDVTAVVPSLGQDGILRRSLNALVPLEAKEIT